VVGESDSHSYFDSEGNRLELEPAQHQVMLQGADGRVRAKLGGLGEDSVSLNGPVALAFGPNRTIYVVDRGNRRVQVYDYQGRHLQMLGGGGTNVFGLPGGLAFDEHGRLLVTDTLRQRVVVFDARGVAIGDFGGSSSPLEAPRGIAVGPDGTIHVADPGSSGVHAFDSSGRYAFSHRPPNAVDALFRPQDIVIDPSGELVYITDPTYVGLYVSRADGTFVARKDLVVHEGALVAPGAAVHVSVMPGGDIYVSALPASDWRTAA
jgi:DNA-binding beta-propeller fold protein YncE